MVKVGQKYYFFVHAYHHIVGKVVAITGKREVVLENVARVQSSGRGWPQFWEGGFANDTIYAVFPDGTGVAGWMMSVPWKHDIPRNNAVANNGNNAGAQAQDEAEA